MTELLNHMGHLWWGWTASMFWQVGLLILLIGGVDRLIRRWAWPQLRYALWSLILVKLLLPPSLSLPSGVIAELQPRVAQVLQWLNSEKPTTNERSTMIMNLESQISDFDVRANMLGPATQQTEETSSSVLRPLSSGPLIWQFYALNIWFLGTLTLGTGFFLRLHRVAGRHAHEAAGASLPQSFYNHLADCSKRLGLHRIPRVIVTEWIPTIYLFV